MSFSTHPDQRPSEPDTGAPYRAAIARAKEVFKKNKSRMWVLKILDEYIREEIAKTQEGNQ